MQLAVISDLHLGRGDATDCFGHDDGEFLGFLRRLEREFEQIVLLGDIWETLTGPVPARADLALADARRHHAEIARRFEGPQYRYVVGNHDHVAASALGAVEAFSVEADRVRLLFTHGHQNDALVRRARCVAELGVWIGGWFRRARLGGVYSAFRRLDEMRSGMTQEQAEADFEQWACDYARQSGADVIVTGHTHFAARVEHGDQLFLNSGSCSEGKFSYLSIDTQRGAYDVHQSP
jgi:predicted phosphodiesterase